MKRAAYVALTVIAVLLGMAVAGMAGAQSAAWINMGAPELKQFSDSEKCEIFANNAVSGASSRLMDKKHEFRVVKNKDVVHLIEHIDQISEMIIQEPDDIKYSEDALQFIKQAMSLGWMWADKHAMDRSKQLPPKQEVGQMFYDACMSYMEENKEI